MLKKLLRGFGSKLHHFLQKIRSWADLLYTDLYKPWLDLELISDWTITKKKKKNRVVFGSCCWIQALGHYLAGNWNIFFIFRWLTEAFRVSAETDWYLKRSMIPSILTRAPVPGEEQQNPSVMPPPLGFTLRFGWWAVLFVFVPNISLQTSFQKVLHKEGFASWSEVI